MKNISEKIEVIPAHVWTPWFGVFGSKSGFNSLKDAFGSQYSNIHAVETGISSTPEMNLKLKELHDKTIVSFSDSHSFWPWRMGREMTIFSKADSYDNIIDEIRNNKIIGTVEVNPAYGMYHYDGHRACNFSCSPEETKKLNSICPVCKTKLTIGVDYRVQELTDSKPIKSKLVYEILPLHEVIALVLETSMNSKKVWAEYEKLVGFFKTEMNILLNVPVEDLKKVTSDKIAEMIIKNRQGKIKVKPGYDGVYGEAILPELHAKQLTL
jgi:uncharacterized protein (TIGR00375 family)